jgi:membrane-associated phospholipid phosphatase
MASGPGPEALSAARTVARDTAVVLTGIVVYFGVRGETAGAPEVARQHARDLLALEKELGLDIEAGVQSVLVGVEPLTTIANWVYIWGHWPAIALTLLWLALSNRTVFLRMRNAMIASGAMGLCVYTTYPVAPPRLLDAGYVDTITEQSRSYRVLQPPAFVNQYAALPSLHVGWDLVLGMSLVAAGGTVLLRTIGRAMPVVMAAATVLTANHYLLDVLAGAAFGVAGWMVALWLERRRTEPVLPAPSVDAAPATGPPVDSDRPSTDVPRPREPRQALPAPRQPDAQESVRRGADRPGAGTGRRCPPRR